jgi:hypothetical protein
MKTSLRLTVATLLMAVSDLSAATHYVSLENANPTLPYTNWITAATNIQDAVAIADPSDVVVVTNGVYPGGLAVTKPLTLASVSGPQLTIIDGGGTNRCVSLTDGASLTGFTLTHGLDSYRGGGILCASTNAFVINCVIAYNYVGGFGLCEGGGVYQGTLFNCTVSGNSAVVYDTAWGHAAGGGAYGSTLYNCTLTGNFARGGGGGADSSTLCNCIVYFNTASSDPDCDFSSALNYCCTTLMPTNGVGNITNEPLFLDYAGGNLRLQSNCPCINAGNNAYITGQDYNGVWFTNVFDFDGNPRVVSGTVDVGAYEFQGTGSRISYAWLQQYDLPTDGSADFLDPDHDDHNNWQEWRCQTNPTNGLSALRLVSAASAGSNVLVTWQSVIGVNYFLECNTNLAASPCFTCVATNLPGQAGTTTYTHTNAAAAPCLFYRVGVSQ